MLGRVQVLSSYPLSGLLCWTEVGDGDLCWSSQGPVRLAYETLNRGEGVGDL